MSPSIVEMTKDLVVAQIQSGTLSPDDMHDALRRVFQSLMSLKSREESELSMSMADTPRAPTDWRTSITRHAITCFECGQTFKQLTGLHLRRHGLNARTYRAKYGMPRTQPLVARETTAKRRQIVQTVRPWEKAPTYMKAQEERAAAAKKAGRKRGGDAKRST